jgi:hypothetical protein
MQRAVGVYACVCNPFMLGYLLHMCHLLHDVVSFYLGLHLESQGSSEFQLASHCPAHRNP